MSHKYAANTSVSVGKSQDDIRNTLRRYGADSIAFCENKDLVTVAFQMRGRNVLFQLPMPTPQDDDVRKSEAGRKRNQEQIAKAYDQKVKQVWRVLLLAIKGKLELISSGCLKFEDEFMAYVMLPDGRTVSTHLLPRIEQAYESGSMPPLLPESTHKK